MQNAGSHISFDNRTLTLFPHYIRNQNGQLYPVHLVAFELCYEYLSRFRASPGLYVQLSEFQARIRARFSELSFIEEKDIFFRNSSVRLDSGESIIAVRFGDVEEIVQNVYLTDLVFLARLFFRLDFVNQLISCQPAVLSVTSFEVTSQHMQICRELVRKSRDRGISRSRLYFYLICCLIKYKYQGKSEDDFSHYRCPYPFALDTVFAHQATENDDFSFVVGPDNVKYVPPYNIWTEQDMCNGLINQQFPAGVLFNQVEPQLMLAQITFNEMLDAAKAATDVEDAQSQTTFAMTNQEFQEMIRTQYNKTKIQQDTRQIQMKQMLNKFRELKQLCDLKKCEYTSYAGDYLFFMRPQQMSRLKPEDRRKIAETLRGQKNIKFEEAQNACANFIKDYISKKDSRKLKKTKEKKKTQDKWLNDHVKDDWYLTARQHD